MKRLLARPPELTLNSSFAEAYRSGRFTQLELMSDAELISEARKHDLTVRRETLEELDRYGAFTPVAFVGADWRGDFCGPRWNVAAMTFRDDAGFQRWSRYRFREDGFRRVTALYSPWQLMYLKSALEDRLVLFTLPYVLGRRDRLLRGLKNARPFWRIDRDLWQSLEANWRPLGVGLDLAGQVEEEATEDFGSVVDELREARITLELVVCKPRTSSTWQHQSTSKRSGVRLRQCARCPPRSRVNSACRGLSGRNYASTRITKLSGTTPSCAMASAAAPVSIAPMTASMSATSMSTATRVGFCGSTNVRMLVTPRGPKNSSRFGEASQ